MCEGVDLEDAKLFRERVVTRLIDNREVRIVYRIFKKPGSSEVPTVPGLLPRREYGIEVLILIATLVYLYRLSIARTCRVQRDGRDKQAGRERAARGFEDRLGDLLGDELADESEPVDDHAREFRNLFRKLSCLLMKAELFVFVTSDEAVTGTNNKMEQGLREAAMYRRTDQTSRTLRGARRRTVIVTVLESTCRLLGASRITLESLLEHVQSWTIRGRSVFTDQLARLGLNVSTQSRLDRIFAHGNPSTPQPPRRHETASTDARNRPTPHGVCASVAQNGHLH